MNYTAHIYAMTYIYYINNNMIICIDANRDSAENLFA